MVDAAQNGKVQEESGFVKRSNGPLLLLWDIDGTLMSSDGAGRSSMEFVFEEMYDIPRALDQIELAGRTDAAILLDLLSRHKKDSRPDIIDEFRDRYFCRLRRVIGSRHSPVALPGVTDTLKRLNSESGYIQGLLTGNWRESAFIKLNSVRLDDRFCNGAFAEDAPTRPELLPVALDRFSRQGYQGLNYERTVIIGDTPYDIAVAKAYGARSVAIATGVHDIDDLRRAKPDVLFQTLDTDRFMHELARWNSKF